MHPTHGRLVAGYFHPNRIHRVLRYNHDFSHDEAVVRKYSHGVFRHTGMHAVWAYRRAHWLLEHGAHPLASLVSRHTRKRYGVEIHPAAQIGRRFMIDHGMGVVIGETAEVGDDCTIYHGVTLGGTSLTKGSKRHPTLEEGVVVGAGAKVLGSFTVGAGAQIGSNAVVVKPVPAGAVVVGVPGRATCPKTAKKPGCEEKTAEEKPRESEFHAYGVSAGDRDPYAVSILELVRVVEAQSAEIRRLSGEVKALGGKAVDDVADFNRSKLWASARNHKSEDGKASQ